MEFVTMSELKNKTSKVVHKAERGEAVVVMRHGKPRAVMISVAADEIDQLLFETSPLVHGAVREGLEDLKAHRTVTLRGYLRGRRSA